MISELSESLTSAKGVVFANFQGLKMTELDELRATCRTKGVSFMAGKKTLVGQALKSAGINADVSNFSGGVSVATSPSDEVAAAQLLAEFGKKHPLMVLFGGILEGSFIDDKKVAALASLPGKQQLLGQLVGTLNAPVSGFVNVLAGNLRGLVNVLNAVKEQKA